MLASPLTTKDNTLNITWLKDNHLGTYGLRYYDDRWITIEDFDVNDDLQVFHSINIINKKRQYLLQLKVYFGDFESDWSELKIVNC